jgi:hypothetical protein
MKSGQPLTEDLSVDQDPYGVKATLEKSMSQLGN